MHPVKRLRHLGLLAALPIAACAHNPDPVLAPTPAPAAAAPAQPAVATAPAAAAPAPAPAAAAIPANAIDVSGSWSGTAAVQGQTIPLDITLTRAANGTYSGGAAPQGQTAAPLKELRLDGNHLIMVFLAPDGEATFDVLLSADRQAMTGNVQYQGQNISV